MKKPFFLKIPLLAHIKQWPFDKKLTLIFPSIVIFISVITGSWQQIIPSDNKAAIFSIGLFLCLLIFAQFLLRTLPSHSRKAWFLYQFWPIPAILIGYLLMRILRLELAIEAFEIPQQDNAMIMLDTIFFGQTIPLSIQHWVSPLMTLFMETAYLHFYYLLPIGSLVYFFWRQEDARFLQLRQAIIYTLVGGFCCYFIIPVKGPIDFIPEQFSMPLKAGHEVVYAAVNSFRFAYDCFPSLHTAIPWVTLFISWSWHSTSVRLILLSMTLAITLSTLYLRYHYGFDVLAGFTWACIVAYTVKRQRSFLSYQTIRS